MRECVFYDTIDKRFTLRRGNEIINFTPKSKCEFNYCTIQLLVAPIVCIRSDVQTFRL